MLLACKPECVYILVMLIDMLIGSVIGVYDDTELKQTSIISAIWNTVRRSVMRYVRVTLLSSRASQYCIVYYLFTANKVLTRISLLYMLRISLFYYLAH